MSTVLGRSLRLSYALLCLTLIAGCAWKNCEVEYENETKIKLKKKPQSVAERFWYEPPE